MFAKIDFHVELAKLVHRMQHTSPSKVLIWLIWFVPICSNAQTIDPLEFFSQEEVNIANTALELDYLTEQEKDIFLYNNLARLFPSKFHKLFLEHTRLQGKSHLLDTDYYYSTLSDELQTRAPVGLVYPDYQMYELADCWAVESGVKGIIGHNRVDCEGGFGGENCAYGYADGLNIVMQLLIDTGIENLGHRKNMLNAAWNGLGTAIRPHSVYRICAVQDFSTLNDNIRAQQEQERIEREEARAERNRLLELRAQEFDRLMAQWSEEERRKADVCRSLDFLSPLEKDFYFYYNLARINPSKFNELLWEQGPFFDRLLDEQTTDLHTTALYRNVLNYFNGASPTEVFVPEQAYMDAGQCIVRKWKANRNSTDCLPGPGSWRLQTYYPESGYNDVMNIFLTEMDFEDLFRKNSHLVLVEDDQYGMVKVFLN